MHTHPIRLWGTMMKRGKQTSITVQCFRPCSARLHLNATKQTGWPHFNPTVDHPSKTHTWSHGRTTFKAIPGRMQRYIFWDSLLIRESFPPYKHIRISWQCAAVCSKRKFLVFKNTEKENVWRLTSGSHSLMLLVQFLFNIFSNCGYQLG